MNWARGQRSQRLIESWPKFVKNLQRGEPYIISENTQMSYKHDKQEILNENIVHMVNPMWFIIIVL